MFTQYFDTAMKLAEYELMEDGRYWGHIPGFQGVWACEPNLEDCRNELKSVLEDWILVKLWDLDDDIPVLGKMSLLPKRMPPQSVSRASYDGRSTLSQRR